MSKRILALVLALVMTACLFAGCAKTETQTSAEEATAAEAAETPAEAAEAPAEAPAEATETQPGETAEPAEAAAESSSETVAGFEKDGYERANEDGTYTTPCGVSYPLEGSDLEVSYWNSFMSMNSELTTNNDLPCIPMIKEATGVLLKFVEVSASAASEQFQLMIASGDYTDLLKLSGYYTGGEAQAYEDEVIIDLTDSLPENAPDYWNLLMQQPESAVNATKVEGLFVTVNGIKDGSYTDRGLVVRYDLLEEMGLAPEDICKSVDAFTDFLYQTKETYGMENTLSIGAQGHFYSDMIGIAIAAPLFDTPLVDLTNSTSAATYVEDGTVVSAYVGDNYREYVKWFNKLYNDGLFDQDFYTNTDQDAAMTTIGTGNTMVWASGADTIDRAMQYMDENNADADIEAIPAIVNNEDYVNTWGAEVSCIDLGYSISVECEDPEMVETFLNYFFTDPGYILVNFGEEGVSFNFNEEGEPHFTELVTNNPDLPPMGAAGYYGLNEIPYLKSESKLFDAYSDAARNAITVWTSNAEIAGRVYPTTISLTTQESDSIKNALNDCLAYGQENLLKFMTGVLDVSDDAAWEEYKAGMESFGLQDVLDVYQTALDETNAGLR